MHYIYEYHSMIESGKVVVGTWIKAIYNIIIKGLENGAYTFDAKKANKAIKFIETYAVRPPVMVHTEVTASRRIMLK